MLGAYPFGPITFYPKAKVTLRLCLGHYLTKMLDAVGPLNKLFLFKKDVVNNLFNKYSFLGDA